MSNMLQNSDGFTVGDDILILGQEFRGFVGKVVGIRILPEMPSPLFCIKISGVETDKFAVFRKEGIQKI